MESIGPPLPSQFISQPASPSSRSGQALTLPQPGQLLNALVIEVREASTYLLQLGSQQLLAKSDLPLQVGQSLQLQLRTVSPQIELQIASDPLQQLASRSLPLLGTPLDLGPLIGLLQQSSLFSSLSESTRSALLNFLTLQQTLPDASSGGNLVKNLSETLGLNLERLLDKGQTDHGASTLKAAMLELLSTFKPGSEIHHSASRTLSLIESLQLVQLQADAGQQFIIPLPFAFLQQGFLLIDYQGKGGSSDRSQSDETWRFSLFLTMIELGHLRIDFARNLEGLMIRFHTDSQEKAAFVAAFRPELEQALGTTPLLGISFAADAQDPATELVRLIVPSDRPVLNTTA